ncbi:phosphatase PAP2 family protein [Faecalicoccus pleomorphus]
MYIVFFRMFCYDTRQRGKSMNKNITVTMISIGCIFLCIGTFWDLEINTLFYDPQNRIGIFLQEGWPLLLKLILTLCFALLIDQNHPFFSIPWFICGLLFSQNVITLTESSWFSFISIGAILTPLVVSIFICYKLTTEQKNKLRPYIINYLQLFFTVLIVITLFKVLWGRIRFRDMQQASQFCVWYLPCHKGGFSFPSGHTSSFACSLLYLLSTPLVQKHKLSLSIIVCTSIFLMMASRIVMGAHFLSDTAAGMMIALVIWAFYDRRWKNKISKRKHQ